MIELGKYQILEVSKKTDFGLYLSEPGKEDSHRILLPIKEAPDETKLNDKINVFVYKDSEDREIATTAEVPLTVGGTAVLKVKEITKIGAFLDWGLMKDLLLPFKEQTHTIKEDDNVLVALYVDKSKRLCATMKVYEYLLSDSNYKLGDMVSGIVYDKIDNFGIFVAVDNIYSALIPNNELFKPLKYGDIVKARISNIREDKKLTLSLRDKSYIQMDSDSDMILKTLISEGGFLPFHDKSDAEDIKNKFQISKNAFKRAIGKLYKSGSITIDDDGIRLTK
ncbi:MAG: S1 RNA-binding domain-containing protein [Clostridiales bacterium]|jgi:predicted RNA-binding protein (virulence factor B family)|nr:S1 RNA-binding domain-containing protein [Clostridiales bacterium]